MRYVADVPSARTATTATNPRIAALIALALLLKALVPAGWMPAFEGGALTLRVCGAWAEGIDRPQPSGSGHGHHTGPTAHGSHAAHNDEPQHHGEGPGTEQPCAFAATGQSDGPTGPNVETLPLATQSAAPVFPHTVALGRGLAAPPPPSTGPPHLS